MTRSALGRTAAATFALLTLLVVGALPLAADEKSLPQGSVPTSLVEKPTPTSVADLAAIEKQVKKVTELIRNCTVAVRVGGAHGSGVIINKEGYILTAGHVAGDAGRRAVITFNDGRQIRAVTLGRNRDMDSGMVKITGEGSWDYAKMGSSGDLKRGQWCIATGHPGGFQRTRGVVVRLGRVVELKNDSIRTDCTLVGGDSGGPLFDLYGRVIGIHSRIAAPLTMNFHVPIDTYRDTWDRLAKSEVWGGPPTGPIIGIRGEDVEAGCRVTQIFSGLPAERAGLEEGDVITRFEGKKVGSLKDLQDHIAKRKAGDEVTVVLRRDGREISKTMTLARRSTR